MLFLKRFATVALILVLAAAVPPARSQGTGTPSIELVSGQSADPGAALLIARHAIAVHGATPDQIDARDRATIVLADDPVATLIGDRLRLESTPADPTLLGATIDADLDDHDWPDALTRLSQLAALAPGDGQTRFQLAILLIRTDPKAAALQLGGLVNDPTVGALAQQAAQALNAAPDSRPIPVAQRTIGLQQAGAGQWALAIALLAPIAHAAPQDNVAIALLGTAQEAQGHDGWALTSIALANAPNDPLVRYAAALHYQHNGDSQTTLQLLLTTANDNSLALPPAQQAGLDLTVAVAYTQAGTFDVAAAYYQKAVNLVPRDAGLAEQFAAFYADTLYRPDLAYPFVKAAVAQFPKDASLSASLAQLLLNARQTQNALDAARRAVSLDLTSAYPDYVLGRCLAASGDSIGAQIAYRAAFNSHDPAGATYRELAAKALTNPAKAP